MLVLHIVYMQLKNYNLSMRQNYQEHKVLLFEYIIKLLIDWYRAVESSNQEDIDRHFSRLTSLKLLFFVSTIKHKNGKDLLDTFSNFYAMQYGPVEADIYNGIVKSSTKIYHFGTHSLSHKDKDTNSDSIFSQVDSQEKTDIQTSINLLKERNPQIISYNASKLINISHKWEAWQNAMTIAVMLGKGSEQMPKESIRSNPQIYE